MTQDINEPPKVSTANYALEEVVREITSYISITESNVAESEPVWPSGKALGW